MRFDFGAIENYILGGIIYSSLSAYILFFFNKKDVRANRLLALGLLGVTWYCFIFLATRFGWILKFTWLYGYGIPIYYTVPVFFYWYVHRYTDPEQRPHRRNYWHFLPSLISFIALIPFYLCPSSVKLGVINEIVLDLGKIMTVRVGWIPLSWHLIIRPVHAGVYLWFQWRLILRVKKNSGVLSAAGVLPAPRVLSAPLKKWLICFTLLETLIYLSLAVTTVIGLKHVSLGWEVLTVARWPYAIGILLYLFTGLFLFTHPEILYGTARPERRRGLLLTPMPASAPLSMPASAPSPSPATEFAPSPATEFAPPPAPAFVQSRAFVPLPAPVPPSDDEELSRYALLLKEYVAANELYKRPKLTLHLLASGLGVSPRMVSSVLNKYYKQRFTEYINTHRIAFVISRLDNQDWQEMTLEGLGREAGFSSKSTFFAAFKKETSISPGEYLNRIAAKKKAVTSQ